MGQITKAEIIKILTKHNKDPRMAGRIHQYAACLASYLDAEDNLERNGTIVAHPRTGSPIENPYLKVRSVCMADMHRYQPPDGRAELWKIIMQAPD